MSGKTRGRRSIPSNWIENLENRRLLSANSSIIVQPALDVAPQVTSTTPYGYSPAQIEKAYGISETSSSDGAGQTIAIIDAYSDPNISSDLAAFDAEFGLSAPPSLKVVNQTGGASLPASNSSWDLEISLDVEMAHEIAPDASILLVEASSSTLGNLLTAVNYARDVSGVSVVSMSWGSTEFSTETSYDGYFTTPSGHIGVTFVASSGDEGGYYGALWPAISPNVLSVGGTTLTLSSSGGYGSETAWSDSTGGVSDYEPEPAYQDDAQGEGRATAPDVAFDANPATGVDIYDSVSYDGQSGWFEVGGTSAGAPAWSGLVADADQGRVAKGLGTLTSQQTLTTLFSAYSNSTTYANDFHDITSGNNGVWLATVGYDAVTGLGSPKGTAIVSALIGTTVVPNAPAKTVSTQASTGTGSKATIEHDRSSGATSVPSEIAVAAVRHDSWAFQGAPALGTTVAWMPAAADSTAAPVVTPVLPAVSMSNSQSGSVDSDLIFADGPAVGIAGALPGAVAVADADLVAQPAGAAVKVAAALGSQAKSAQEMNLAPAAAASAALSDDRDFSATSRWAALIGGGVFLGAWGVRARQNRRGAARAAVGKRPVLEGRIFTP
jgi:hypothetical protein